MLETLKAPEAVIARRSKLPRYWSNRPAKGGLLQAAAVLVSGALSISPANGCYSVTCFIAVRAAVTLVTATPAVPVWTCRRSDRAQKQPQGLSSRPVRCRDDAQRTRFRTFEDRAAPPRDHRGRIHRARARQIDAKSFATFCIAPEPF